MKNQRLVVVIDGTKARFFTLEPAEFPEYESGPNLIEQDMLTDAAKGMHGQELWANTKTGRNKGSNGRAHAYDDRRGNHMIEFERKFAQSIVQKIGEFDRSRYVDQLTLVAEPQILGILRDYLSSINSNGRQVKELAKDLCHLSARDLHDYLAKHDFLPACKSIARQ